MKKLTRAKLMGAFMQETRDLIRSAASGTIIHLCSGTWNYGITVDRKMEADILADVQFLPFKDSIADTVIFDPPYSKKFKRIYGNYYANRREVFKEVIRILKPGGLLIFCHYFIPAHRIWQLEAVFMIHNRPWEHVRALSFLRKRATLMPIYPEQITELPEEKRPLATLFDKINGVAAEKEKERRQEKRSRSKKGSTAPKKTRLLEKSDLRSAKNHRLPQKKRTMPKQKSESPAAQKRSS